MFLITSCWLNFEISIHFLISVPNFSISRLCFDCWAASWKYNIRQFCTFLFLFLQAVGILMPEWRDKWLVLALIVTICTWIMPLFGKSQKSPAEVVKALKEAVNALERGDKKAEKVHSLCWCVITRQICTVSSSWHCNPFWVFAFSVKSRQSPSSSVLNYFLPVFNFHLF